MLIMTPRTELAGELIACNWVTAIQIQTLRGL
jgi:hypothetical protein